MLIRAVPLKDFLTSALSTSAPGTAYSTVAPTAGQSFYAALHLTSFGGAGTTTRVLVGSIQAASSSGFSPLTTEITFALTSSEGSTWTRQTAPSTDRPWRRAYLEMTTAASTDNTWKGLIWGGLK